MYEFPFGKQKKKKSLSQRTVEIPALTSEASPCLLFFLFLLHFLFRHLYSPSLSISTPLISLMHLRIFPLHSPPTQRLPYKKKGRIDRKKRKIWFLNSISLSFLFKYPLSEKKSSICLHCLLPSPTFSATREFTLHETPDEGLFLPRLACSLCETVSSCVLFSFWHCNVSVKHMIGMQLYLFNETKISPEIGLSYRSWEAGLSSTWQPIQWSFQLPSLSLWVCLCTL